MVITALIGTMPTNHLRVKRIIRPLKKDEEFKAMTVTQFEASSPSNRKYYWQKYIVTEVKKGDEVGLVLKPDLPFQVGDGIISYKVKK